MLCNFCSNIDLDQVATPQGYKHHSSCADLFQSVRSGCGSCKLIWDSQRTWAGGDLRCGYDQGSLDTQIIATAVNQEPGSYEYLRFGQVARQDAQPPRVITANPPESNSDNPLPSPFLWSFVMVAACPGAYHPP